jgi:two-component sensor histidine kinase
MLLVIILIITLRLKTVREKNKIIEKQNDERKLLLQEVHHRVKNNFQIVSSLLRLQSYTVNDESVTKTFNEAITRINAMAIVHDIIYRQEEFSNISNKLYLNKLVEGLERTVIDRNIHFQVDADENPLEIETLIHIGIIINELVINTIKYAFPKNFDKSAISISLTRQADRYCLVYKDNGVGINPELKKDSFGMELIETIIEQLDGTIEMKKETSWNTAIHITFKETNISQTAHP